MLIALPFTPAMDLLRKVKRSIVEIVESRNPEPPEPQIIEKEKIVIREVEVPPPLPPRFVPYKRVDVAELWNQFEVKTEFHMEQGEPATKERNDRESFTIEMTMNVRIPEPSTTLEELESINPSLGAILPDLSTMLENGKVSGFFDLMYERKVDRMQTYLTRMDRILSKHNFYDLETVLELEHPETGQKVLLLQGEMDVDADGSDGDRQPVLDEAMANSTYYQPFTSYGWKKTTKNPNPLLPRWEKKLADAKAAKEPSRSNIDQLQREIDDMKYRSFLLGKADPFMVIPLSYLGYHNKSGWGPQIGDYAVVIHGDQVFPVIIGDAGPSFKMGEGSLRLAREINPKSSPYSRPVSDLTVTYLVFPQSRDTFGQPDLEKWHAKCAEFLEKIGGLGDAHSLHEWSDFFAEDEGEEVNPEQQDGGA
ncbi:MAG: glycoside hydrolase family 75 protein [Verrucomicrobiota bacterium]